MNLALTAIDVAIGLSFVFLLVSLMCSVLQEVVANITSWRGKHLRTGIMSMLNDPNMVGLARRLYAHPRIATLSLPGKLPSYIPSVTFAKALTDIIVEDGNLSAKVDGPLAPFIKDAAGQVDKLEADLTQWYDQSMDRLSGWYKRNVQLVLLAIGFVIAVTLNIDSLQIARSLWTQPLLRDVVTQSAGKFYDENKPAITAQNTTAGDQNVGKGEQNAAKDRLETLQKTLEETNLPVGWTDKKWQFVTSPKLSKQYIWTLLASLAGWFVTALASSLGTQFWFQTLGEALSLRAAGAKPSQASQAGNATKKSGAGG
jgi:hypothetical protein